MIIKWSISADFQLSSLPACTAWSTANKSAGRFASPLPDGCFLQPPDQCFLARRLLPLVRNRSLVTAFRSPATAATFRRPPFRGQSSQPATSLPSRLFPCPFGLRLHYRLPDCAGLRPLHCLDPLHFLLSVRRTPPLQGAAEATHQQVLGRSILEGYPPWTVPPWSRSFLRSSWQLAHLSSKNAEGVCCFHVAILPACAVSIHHNRISLAWSQEQVFLDSVLTCVQVVVTSARCI
jgi:hypothetical protein